MYEKFPHLEVRAGSSWVLFVTFPPIVNCPQERNVLERNMEWQCLDRRRPGCLHQCDPELLHSFAAPVLVGWEVLWAGSAPRWEVPPHGACPVPFWGRVS